MDIAHLKTFLEIYQTRHFSKAAEKLFITQSAASARIKLLEEQLGVKLFIRDKRNIQPTPAACRFHKYAEMAVTGWEQARQVVALPDDYQQSLSISCMADIWHLFLKNWIVDIKHQHDGIALNLNINHAPTISELLINGALDLGLVFEPLYMPTLDIEEILVFQIKLFSTQPNLSLDEALNNDYVMVDWGASFAYEYAQHYANQEAAIIQTDYGVMALDILNNQGGSAYLPELVALKNDKGLVLYEVNHAPVFERKLYAVYRKNTELYVIIKNMIAMIRGLIQTQTS